MRHVIVQRAVAAERQQLEGCGWWRSKATLQYYVSDTNPATGVEIVALGKAENVCFRETGPNQTLLVAKEPAA